MITEFRFTLGLLGLSEFLENLGDLEVSRLTKDSNESKSRFNLDDVRFYNPFYESKFVNIILVIEYTRKSTLFKIFIFLLIELRI